MRFSCCPGFILSYVYVRLTGAGQFDYRSFIWTRMTRTLPLCCADGVIGSGAEHCHLFGGVSGHRPGDIDERSTGVTMITRIYDVILVALARNDLDGLGGDVVYVGW